MATATQTADETAQETQSPRPKRGFKKQPPKGPPVETGPAKPFWERVCDLTNEDWQRSELFIYLLEPVADLTKLSGKKYYKKYTGEDDAPRSDADILKELGSGKYRLMLNRRKPGADKSDMVDLHEFTEFNMNLPPKLPKKFWLKDPRNERWETLLPEDPQQQQAAAPGAQPSFVETARLLQEIRRDAREEALESQPMQPEPIDPVEALKGVASVMKEMKADTPKDTGAETIMKMMTIQQASQDANMKAIREELAAARAREHELNMKLIEASKPQPAQESEITKLIVKKFVEDKIEGKETPAEVPERRGRVTGMDILHDVAVALPNSPIMANIGNAFQMWMQMKMMEQQVKMQNQRPQPQQARHQPAALPGPGIPEPPQEQMQQQPQQQSQPQGAPPVMMTFTPQQLADFLPQIIGPVCNIMDQQKDGYDLAEWFRTQFGSMYFDVLRNQGKEKIFAAIQMSQYWGPFIVNGRQHSGFAVLEPQLKNMIEEFCNWPPPDDESEEDDDDPADEPEVL